MSSTMSSSYLPKTTQLFFSLICVDINFPSGKGPCFPPNQILSELWYCASFQIQSIIKKIHFIICGTHYGCRSTLTVSWSENDVFLKYKSQRAYKQICTLATSRISEWRNLFVSAQARFKSWPTTLHLEQVASFNCPWSSWNKFCSHCSMNIYGGRVQKILWVWWSFTLSLDSQHKSSVKSVSHT